jgi:hypothetical protein
VPEMCTSVPACVLGVPGMPERPAHKKTRTHKNPKSAPKQGFGQQTSLFPAPRPRAKSGPGSARKKGNNSASGLRTPSLRVFRATPYPSPWSTDLKLARPKFAYIMILCSWEDRQKAPSRPVKQSRWARSTELGLCFFWPGSRCQTHVTAATAPLLMPPAWVRAGSIEGPVPSAALCEATTSAARSPSSLV